MSLIQLRSGKMFDVFNPDPESISIDDIAWALSHQCRFSGHCARFYSVAEHSVHVSNLVPQTHAKTALLHDAAEAYIVDLPRPIKRELDGYKEIEANVEAAVAMRFGLSFPWSAEVKHADERMLGEEARQLMSVGVAWSWWMPFVEMPPVAVDHLGHPPEHARQMFLERAEELGVR